MRISTFVSSCLLAAAAVPSSTSRTCLAFTRPALSPPLPSSSPATPTSYSIARVRPSIPFATALRSSTSDDNVAVAVKSDDGDDEGGEEQEGGKVLTSGPVSVTNCGSGRFEGASIIEFLLLEHKPLGCTAEESLAVEEDEDGDRTRHVFVSKVVEGGNAENAGIATGDVIIGVSGSFDDVVNVAGLGLEKVQAYIAGRDPTSPLTVRVARGTDVEALHESALVDLCTMPEMDSDMEDCIATLNTYAMDFEDDSPAEECQEDEGTECVIEQMYQDWGEEMKIEGAEKDMQEEDNPKEKRKKPAPWSSRSSPSGTFVRDPSTGKMVNIDA